MFFCLLFLSVSCIFNSSAVGVGFYGNSETNDGVYQLTYSLYNANHTLGGISNLVREACHAPLHNLQSHQRYLCQLQFTNFPVESVQVDQAVNVSVLTEI